MSSDNVNMLVTWLVQLGVPSAVVAAITALVRASRKRKALIAAAPDQKIETSMARMQQAAIAQDSLIDNFKDALTVQTSRAEAAEERERVLLSRLAEVEQQLAGVTAQLNQARHEVEDIRAQMTGTPRTETP